MNKQQRIAHNAQSAAKMLNAGKSLDNLGNIFYIVDEKGYELIKDHLKAIIELAGLPKGEK